jgi:hypothetical protein
MHKTTKNAKINCGKRLLEIAPAVVATDRQKAMATFQKSYVTICRYLQGNVANLVLGIDLLHYFSDRIKMREAELNKLL